MPDARQEIAGDSTRYFPASRFPPLVSRVVSSHVMCPVLPQARGLSDASRDTRERHLSSSMPDSPALVLGPTTCCRPGLFPFNPLARLPVRSRGAELMQTTRKQTNEQHIHNVACGRTTTSSPQVTDTSKQMTSRGQL
ncbi:hypothetical protein EYF80_011439 [Liparis tanakae]|uniref:Uncharacterized protein n=1 Tax=Liparis tanakae TaxID=230148 RepID=A0A4Z2IJP2_9TELE|nr:hypothetical protein EYF80_011439 [Liparis tanakae]